jgi:1,4-alpha-glucan branching enzyme
VGMALLLLAPQIPLLFMGEEHGAREPFLFFADYQGDLAEAVKTGRRKEFGKFPEFATEAAQRRIRASPEATPGRAIGRTTSGVCSRSAAKQSSRISLARARIGRRRSPAMPCRRAGSSATDRS